MTKRILTTIAATALLVPALAFAEVAVVNGEAGMVFKDAPSAVTRNQVQAELKSAKSAADFHFKYVGGEAAWAHETPSHKFVTQAGQLVHAADCPVMAALNAPKSSTGSYDLSPYNGA